MVVTVTMQPAIDKTVDIERMERGGLNRIKRVVLDAGGKGINVSKTIKELGLYTIATGFIGGTAGEVIEKVLKEYGIPTGFVVVDGETRTNMKVVEAAGEVTELNEPGPIVSEEKINELIQKLEHYASEDTLFVLAGSIPSGMDKTIYKKMIETVHKKGAKVFLDADGELFVNSLEAKPDMIKPNRAELEELFQLDYRASEQEIISMAQKLIKKGIPFVAVSLGQMGALFVTEDRVIRCAGLSVKANSTVGAGDAMVDALLYGWDKKMSLEERVKMGIAVSAGAVTTIGTKPPTRELVDELYKKVKFEVL